MRISGLFKPGDMAEGGTGALAGAGAALSFAQAAAAGPEDGLHDRLRAALERGEGLVRALEAHCHRIDLAPDLAEDIGSRRWFRGLATLIGLSATAFAFWPDFTAVETAAAMPVNSAARDEFRSQIIMPLALGGDNGSRMGPDARVLPLAAAPERPRVELTATLAAGDSFARMLQRAGVGPGDAARVADMIAGQVALGDISPGTRFAIVLGRRDQPGAPRPLERLDFRARFDLALAIQRGEGGGLVALPRPIAVDATPLRIRGKVGNSLYRSARAAGAPVKAIQQYLRTLDGHLSLEGDIAASDHFDIVVAHKRAATGESETGDLLYAGLERDGKPKAQLLRWGKDGQFFEASGMGKQVAGMVSPVNGRMTSQYGPRRHPILGYTRMHAGIDFGAPWGAPIFAVSDGVVAMAGRHGGHGNYVRLNHGGGLATGYSHMSRIAVSPGTRVRTGQVIGYVGSTGLSTGPHLHYELYKDGRTVNPLSVRFTVQAQVDKQELARFKARLAELKAIPAGAALQPLAPPPSSAAAAEREIDKAR
jgi:murein DD-endopeptidase MepM/ murein hydrolase activator NlpD